MKGFTDKALVLLPKDESVYQRGPGYMANLKLALDVILEYLASRGIEAHMFYTDDVARDIGYGKAKFVSSLGKGDLFFVSKNCKGMGEAMKLPMITYDDAYAKALKKVPVVNDLPLELHFSDVVKRSNHASREIIKKYKVIVNFVRKGNPNYSVKSKSGDGVILVNIDALTFIPTTYMSGDEVNQCGILDVPYGNRSLLVWRNP